MKRMARALSTSFALLIVGATHGCGGGKSAPPPPPCDQACLDGIAIRAMREEMKLAFNLTFQGQPVGDHDFTVACPLGGTARVFGNATSNALQGSTMVKVTFVLDHCAYDRKDDDPKQTYQMTVNGTITEDGTLAVQPTSTTALDIKSDTVSLTGNVYDPPIDYSEASCPVALGQDGNNLSGTACGRTVWVLL